MSYSEKQIAEWVADLYSKVYGDADDVAKIESAARTLISAVRKETREECAQKIDELYPSELTYIARNCAAAIRNLQEREEK